ncbi:MAG: hypothetical protein IJC41_01065 [Firmicutes bacterium]|nr:hypothetical protein [Bacillota bacterium]
MEFRDPIYVYDQKNVNNGYGIMYSIDRGFFPKDGVKLFYVRNDMFVPSDEEPAKVPEWISNMEADCKKFSSGLKNVQTEVIQYSFDGQPPCSYYAITFGLDKACIRESIQIGDDCWYPTPKDPYIFTIMDIMGEYEYAIGWINGTEYITIERVGIDFS